MEAIVREKRRTARDQVRRRWGLGICRTWWPGVEATKRRPEGRDERGEIERRGEIPRKKLCIGDKSICHFDCLAP
jgi:hypothetical protein